MSVNLSKSQVADRLELVLDDIRSCRDRLENPLESEDLAATAEWVAGRLDALGTVLSDTLEHV